MEVVLALDQGSSSSRALAFDRKGRLVASAQLPVKTFHPQAGWVEHDALDLARAQERALDLLLARLAKKTRVVAAGLACQRSTVVLWDRRTGHPVCRAPSWQDGRAAAVVAALVGRQAEAHDTTGLYLTPYYSAPKIRWLLDNVPAARALAEAGALCAAPVGSFLIWRLTKGEVYAVDPSLAQRMMLLNLRDLGWDAGMLGLFGLDRAILPCLQPSAAAWGVVERGGRRFPLLACLGDQQAAMLGLGGGATGASVANYGTGAFFLHNTGPAQHRIPGLLTSIGWQAPSGESCFLQEGTVHAAGTSFDWLRENLRLLPKGQDVEKACRNSKQRVFALPAIGGLGAPRWDYTTKTTFFGLNSQTAADDLVRGIAEGLAFLMADIVNAMRAGGLAPAMARVSGGLSRIDYLMQFQADITGLELQRSAQTEATALGVAALAVRQAGDAEWAETLAAGRTDKLFKPAMPGEERGRLLAAWARFVAAQAQLSREMSAA